jgi:predicted thioredoxin/glutaredoxin
MRFFALERDIENVNWEGQDELLHEEAAHVLRLMNEGVVEEIYFTEEHNAILFLLGEDLEKIQELVDAFPLVKAGLIRFEVHGLLRYDGFERLSN